LKTLVTGSASGIGRYLLREFCADGFTRKNSLDDIKNKKYDLIIHCATNHCRNINSQNIAAVYDDNLFLTHSLTTIADPNTIFIYFSSVEVYPNRTEQIFNEDEILVVDQTLNLYGITKLMGEEIVRRMSKRHLIIRPGLLLGEFMRPNSVSKVIAATAKPIKISLTHDSEFYVVSYEEVLNFIRIALDRAAWGTYNVLHSEVITLGNVAKIYNSSPEWGAFRYSRPKISNMKSAMLVPSLKTLSYQNLVNWFEK